MIYMTFRYAGHERNIEWLVPMLMLARIGFESRGPIPGGQM